MYLATAFTSLGYTILVPYIFNGFVLTASLTLLALCSLAFLTLFSRAAWLIASETKNCSTSSSDGHTH